MRAFTKTFIIEGYKKTKGCEMDEKSDIPITLDKLDERVHEWGLDMCGIWSLPYGRGVLHFDPDLDIKIDTLDLREAFTFLNGDVMAQDFSDYRVRQAFSHYPCNWAWTKKTELSRKIGAAVMVCLFDHQSMDISLDDDNKVNIAFVGEAPSEYKELRKMAEGEK